MSEALARVEAFRRATLQALLDQCSEPQRALFAKLYPDGVPVASLDSATRLCERTVAKNKAADANRAASPEGERT